ncbi:alpha-ketoglutarate-dependent dioxygenase AlkB [Stappia sediminis]|uniref:alpha-ketoglutarate-dependent dioxygenase AlkB n=1 Tax=Stappia sediminis TaxID=2692190 RepID=UPI001FCB3BE8|nr:alpha-ketoglutarate-dependent dioxygenase AlkB [Stappia sediminis]
MERRLLDRIDAAPWRADLKRRVQHYGYRYDYKARRVTRESFLGPLPGWLMPLCERLANDGHFAKPPDQVIVNEYLPGQGIAPHVDCEPCFGDTIASLSLCSGCVMDFTNVEAGERFSHYLEPRSLLVLSGEARYRWRHGIAARKSDPGPNGRIARGRRISLTFRTILLK